MQQDERLVVVTGASSGIGAALVEHLVSRGVTVIAAARRAAALTALAQGHGGAVEPVAADVADEHGRAALVAAVGGRRLLALVHNAGVLEPVGPLSEVSLAEWRHSQAVNVEGPLFLTQALLGPLSGGGRVLHVSSGAAHNPYVGWGAYCTAKAALYMLYQVLREELKGRGIAVGSVRPGVVDTPMQALIRRQTAERFPSVERFIRLKEQGQLRSPEAVAGYIGGLLLDLPAERFSAHEWDINDPAHSFQ